MTITWDSTKSSPPTRPDHLRQKTKGSPLELKPARRIYLALTEELKGVKWDDIKQIKVASGKGVALSDNRWLVYSDRATFPITFPANHGKALVSGRRVLINQSNNRQKVFGEKQVLLLEKTSNL